MRETTSSTYTYKYMHHIINKSPPIKGCFADQRGISRVLTSIYIGVYSTITRSHVALRSVIYTPMCKMHVHNKCERALSFRPPNLHSVTRFYTVLQSALRDRGDYKDIHNTTMYLSILQSNIGQESTIALLTVSLSTVTKLC